MIRLALLVVIAVVVLVVLVMTFQWFRVRAAQQALRENPPKRIALLVKLPKEAERSNVKMARFYARLERLISHDPGLIATNKNVVSAALVGTGGGPSQAPLVRFLLWIPEDLNERIQMELQECYEGQAQIIEIETKDDPLTLWGENYKNYLQWEEEQKALSEQQSQPNQEEV